MTLTAYDLSDGREPISHDEIHFLKRMARWLPEQPLIVNIGAARGASTLALLEERNDAVIFSIDIYECSDEADHIKQAGLDHRRVIRLLGRSQDIGQFFPFKADLVFIDGDHQYDGVLADIKVWPEKVKSGGVFACHDYIPGENPPNNITHVYEALSATILDDYDILNIVDRIIAFRIEGKD